MTSQGQNPSRQPDDQPIHMQISDGDSSDPGSHGGVRSRGPGGPPGSGTTSSGSSDENWFPAAARYKRLSDPIAGGMGVVYKALDVNLDIEVAIKRIRPELAANADLISRFEREAKTQVRLRHPNLVPVRDYAKDDIGPYIVMDWIEGQSLAAAIDTAGPMEWQRAAVLISKIAMALQVAHEAGIIHRDVKPANILLDANGEPFVTDFGLARIETTQSRVSETATNAMLGTINFASPEQQRNPRNACFQSDIWSLGATLYKTVTGFDVLAMRESLIPEQLRPIVLKATEHAIDARYGTMRLMSQALQATATAATSKGASESTKSSGLNPSAIPGESDLAALWRQTQERIEKAHADAEEIAEKRQDYAEAVKILETVPEHLRKQKLYEGLIRRRDRVVTLDATIRDSVARMRSEGLRDAISELLQLQPHRDDMQRLLAQLPAPVSGKALAAGETSAVRPPSLVAPFDGHQAKAAQDAWARHLGIGTEVTNGIGMKFRVIPPGTFDMGSPKSEPNRSDAETLHKVTITQPKLLGVYPVTQAEWTKVMGSNPSHFSGRANALTRFFGGKDQDTSRFPVEQVSWDDCQEYLEKLNQSHGMNGWRYRLPTEAEWEYACRAGTVTPFWLGGELNGKQANCYQTWQGPYLNRPTVVGYGANPFGLYDQHGQVWEWCEDWYGAYDVNASSRADPVGTSSGSSRVLRGGSWNDDAVNCRSAVRYFNVPSHRRYSIGFRLLCELG